ncbi:MAG: UPF0158 family protein [Ilumatobacteraceae bacterium]
MDTGPGPGVPIRSLADVDVRGVAEALDDGGYDTSWWYDPATGQIEIGLSEMAAFDAGEDEVDEPSERGFVRIESAGSRPAYLDMVAFADAVGELRAADLLQRALQGKGAFRRFRDTVEDFPDVRAHWLTYARAAAEARAIEWLAAERYVADADAERGLATCAATMDAVVAAIGRPLGFVVEAAAVVERWAEVEATLDAGHDVTLQRDGRPWATITPR